MLTKQMVAVQKKTIAIYIHLIHHIITNVGLKVAEKLLIQGAAGKMAKKGGEWVAKEGSKESAKKAAFFYDFFTLYTADAISLHNQGEMIEIEKDAFKERAKLVDQLVEKVKSVFADGSGGGGLGNTTISRNNLSFDNPELSGRLG